MNTKEPKKSNKLQIANLIFTVIFGSVISVLLGLLNFNLDKQKTASDFIKIIADKNAEEYSKGLALSSLLRFGLVEPDLLFSAGYRHEDKYGPGILKDLMYEYGLNHRPMRSPLGYLALPAKMLNGKYELKGWAIDDKSKEIRFEIWLNNEPEPLIPEITWEKRLDIKLIFKK